MGKRDFLSIFKITLPVFSGYIAIGIPFGLMLVDAGYPFWMAPFMSVVFYAGAGQYLLVGLFSAGASLAAIVTSIFFVNIRHALYGISLIDKYRDAGPVRPYLMFALTDETFALSSGCTPPPSLSAGAFYGTIAALDHAYWILGSCIGAAAGALIPFDFAGVDFALTALFAVLFLEQIAIIRNGHLPDGRSGRSPLRSTAMGGSPC
jgi:4-azaleucine resistance transporter AzlC